MNDFYKRMSNSQLITAYESAGRALTQTLNSYEQGQASEREVTCAAERTRVIGGELTRRKLT